VSVWGKARKRSNVENMENEEEKTFSGGEKIKILWIIGSDDLGNTWRKHHPHQIFDLLSVYPYNYRLKCRQNRPNDPQRCVNNTWRKHHPHEIFDLPSVYADNSKLIFDCVHSKPIAPPLTKVLFP
jgi:hypothetical protein